MFGTRARSALRLRARPRPQDAGGADGAAQRQRDGRRAVAGTGLAAWRACYYPGLPVAPRSRDRQEADDRLRRHGLRRRRRRLRARRRVSSIASRSSTARRRLGGVESLCSLPVLTSQWGHSAGRARPGGRHALHGATLGGDGRSRRPDRGPRSGAGPLSAAASARPARASCRARLRPGTARPCRRSARSSRGRRDRRTSAGTSRCGTTALAIARWPPALPMSANHRFTNSPALRE